MSKVLYGNKKTGLCREKQYLGPKTSSCPAFKYQMVAPFSMVRPVKCLFTRVVRKVRGHPLYN